MKINKRRNHFFSRRGNGIFSYRYIKRNLLVTAAVAVTAVGIGFVVKYGEALDHSAAYLSSQQTVQEVAEVATEEVKETTETSREPGGVTKTAQTTTLVAQAQESSTFAANCTEGTINVRAEASLDADIVGKLTDGCVGDILETDGDWLKISSGDVTGYVAAEYVLQGEEAENYAEEHKTVTGTVTSETVRVRAEQSTEADVLGLAAKGDVFDVTEQTVDWIGIEYTDGTSGYISADYVDVVETYEYAMTIDDYNAMVAAELAQQEEMVSSEESSEAELMTSDNTTETPTTEASTTETQTTEEATTEAPTTEAPTTEEATENTDTSQYSGAYLLACLVSMEAGYESYDGQLAVANVVLNRVKNGSWGSSISDVIYAPNQFPCATGSTMKNYLANGPLSTAQQAANDALAGNNNIGSFMSFLNVKYVDTDSLSDYKIIGNHCFY